MKVGRPFFCGEFDERIKPAKSFYGSHAMAKTFLEMPRGSSANAKTFFFRFAELPQTPKHIPRDLREYPQTPRQTPRDLREYPQTPRHFPRDLRDSRKHQSISRGTCGTPANTKAFPVGLAELPRGISKSTLAAYSALSKTFSRDKGPLTHVVYEITHFLLAIACKMRF